LSIVDVIDDVDVIDNVNFIDVINSVVVECHVDSVIDTVDVIDTTNENKPAIPNSKLIPVGVRARSSHNGPIERSLRTQTNPMLFVHFRNCARIGTIFFWQSGIQF
jgi:hypothetical protein